MKRLLGLLLCLCMTLGICACGQKAVEEISPWQEQYDLGIRYLSEGNYEEAIIAFTAAIEIDPKRPEAFFGRGDTYEKMGQLEQAMADYAAGLALGDNPEAEEKLNAWKQVLAEQLQEELWPIVCDLQLPLTVDSLVLGETSIETAKDIYSSYPYAFSNLMNDDTEDTVYNCFGMNGMPVPEGREKDAFGFLFAAPVGGAIYAMILQQPGMTAFGALEVGDSAGAVLEFFGFPEVAPVSSLEWVLNSGAQLIYKGWSERNFSFTYRINGYSAVISVNDGVVWSIDMMADELKP